MRPNSIILVEELIKLMIRFLITMRVILHIKVLLVRNKKIIVSLSSDPYYVVHSTEDATSITSWFLQCMYYLFRFKRGLFNSHYCYVPILQFEKPFRYYGKCF